MSNDADLLELTRRHCRKYLDGIANRPVRATADAPTLRAALGADAPLPDAGEPAADVIDRLASAGYSAAQRSSSATAGAE